MKQSLCIDILLQWIWSHPTQFCQMCTVVDHPGRQPGATVRVQDRHYLPCLSKLRRIFLVLHLMVESKSTYATCALEKNLTCDLEINLEMDLRFDLEMTLFLNLTLK